MTTAFTRRVPRRAQLRRQRRQRRRQLAGTIVAVLVVAVPAAVALVHAVTGGDDPATSAAVSKEGTTASGDEASAAPTGPRTALIVQGGAGGNAGSLTVLGTGPRTHHVVLIPPGTMTEVPSFGLEAVGTALQLGGVPLLQATVENLLGVSLDDVVVVDDGRLAALVQNAGDLTVDLPQRVETTDAAGNVKVLWDAGRALIGPEDVGTLWAATGEANDLSRLARQEAFWDAWLTKMRTNRRALPGGSLRPYLDALRQSTPDVDLLPVEALDAGAGTELYKVRDDALDDLVRQALPDAVPLGHSGRPRVQVLNGTGAVGLAQSVTVRLVQAPVRARVEFTGNADRFDYTETQVVFYDRRQQSTAEAVRAKLGVGRVLFGRRPLGIVDITVVVGSDFRGVRE